MEETPINTIQMTRQIRDKHAHFLAEKSHADRIAFFREQSKKLDITTTAKKVQEDNLSQYSHDG